MALTHSSPRGTALIKESSFSISPLNLFGKYKAL